MMRHQFGFVRVGAISNEVEVGNPVFNREEFLRILHNELFDADIICGQELGITAYTCANLFQQQALLDAAQIAVKEIMDKNYVGRLIVVGCPIALDNSLYNCAIVINGNQCIGIVPKQYLPNYKEFYESRWFRGADWERLGHVNLPILSNKPIPFGVDLLFTCDSDEQITVGIEICEDLWMPIPPSSYQAMRGATILLNLSASNETVAKSKYRRDLVVNQSARCIAAYVYASAGPSESSTDLVFGGHCMIAENGSLLAESDRVGNGRKVRFRSHSIVADVDVQKLQFDRRQTTSFDDHPDHRQYRLIPFFLNIDKYNPSKKSDKLKRKVNGLPFIPRDKAELHDRCAEIFGIQVASMMKRFSSIGHTVKPVIGVSGGLDSTLALLALVKTFENRSVPVSYIRGITMPGFGTTDRTKNNAVNLMEFLGVTQETVDIRPLALQAFRDMGHKPFGMIDPNCYDVDGFMSALKAVPDDRRQDLVFENVQARLRTFVLMSKGFVVGTGDLTEAALGWCTYNGDHMSMYNPNCSVPKTLVKFLVQYAAENEFDGGVRNCLLDIVGTPISPELLPVAGDGTIQQTTEGTLGSFELHDFFMFNFVRNGYAPKKILWLSQFADFTQAHNVVDIEKSLGLFIDRFFGNQFKRSCMPDGPKLGSVSFSPRGDWRMPSDAVADVWKNQVKS